MVTFGLMGGSYETAQLLTLLSGAVPFEPYAASAQASIRGRDGKSDFRKLYSQGTIAQATTRMFSDGLSLGNLYRDSCDSPRCCSTAFFALFLSERMAKFDYKRAGEEIAQINAIVETCPEAVKEKCFE